MGPPQMHSVHFHAIDCTTSRWLRDEIMKGSWFAPLPRNTGGFRSKPFSLDDREGAEFAGCESGSTVATEAATLRDGAGCCAAAAATGIDFDPGFSSIEIEDQLDVAGDAFAADDGTGLGVLALEIRAELAPGEENVDASILSPGNIPRDCSASVPVGPKKLTRDASDARLAGICRPAVHCGLLEV